MSCACLHDVDCDLVYQLDETNLYLHDTLRLLAVILKRGPVIKIQDGVVIYTLLAQPWAQAMLKDEG